VGPLPKPTTFMAISRPKWREPIPYAARPYDAQLNGVEWDEFICRQITIVNGVLQDVTGLSYSPNCQQHCLTYRCVRAFPVIGPRPHPSSHTAEES